MNNSTVIFEKYGLINSNVTYSKVANTFLTKGYTSATGNTYFNSIRMAEGILIKEDVGVGYARTFLNGIKIYSTKDKSLIADKTFHSVFYSALKVKNESKIMLIKILEEVAVKDGIYFDLTKAESIIDRLLNNAINTDQRTMIIN